MGGGGSALSLISSSAIEDCKDEVDDEVFLMFTLGLAFGCHMFMIDYSAWCLSKV